MLDKAGAANMKTLLVLGPRDHGRSIAVEEFETARGHDGYSYELIDGKVYVSPKPNLPHDRLLKWLERLVDSYSQTRPDVINYVTTHARVFVPERPDVTAPEPDLAAYKDFPFQVPVEESRWQDVSPVLVAEIVSDEDPEKDLVRNVELYAQVPSIREYWIFDRLNSPLRMIVYRRVGRRWKRAKAIVLGATYVTTLLPGFSLALDPLRA
jgi:Uma2 family endonuclease